MAPAATRKAAPKKAVEPAPEPSPDESELPPVDDSTEGWETVREESPTVIIFDTPGDRFTGVYQGKETIHNPQDGEDFDRHRFTGLDSKPYAINDSWTLQDGLKDVAVGSLVRLTYTKNVETGRKLNPMKDVKVEVKRN